jgi:hypothetical protein
VKKANGTGLSEICQGEQTSDSFVLRKSVIRQTRGENLHEFPVSFENHEANVVRSRGVVADWSLRQSPLIQFPRFDGFLTIFISKS